MAIARDIFLHQIYPIEDLSAYKLHVARWNGSSQPLDVFVRNREEWNRWNSWRGDKNEFNRPFIFSLIDFYPQRDRWLFGGAYEVLSREATSRAHSYRIELLPESHAFIGRLKLRMTNPGRSRSFKFENHYANLVVDELFAEPYSGEPFCGYDRVALSFAELENIILTQRADWKTALQHAKGIYLITDDSNGKRYVGSAYGGAGIWSRWECYIGTGHGNNDELCKVIANNGIDHARHHFRFALIEHMLPNWSDELVLQRESHWKRILLTRGDYGYNKN
jgi:hypothetical protein